MGLEQRSCFSGSRELPRSIAKRTLGQVDATLARPPRLPRRAASLLALNDNDPHRLAFSSARSAGRRLTRCRGVLTCRGGHAESYPFALLPCLRMPAASSPSFCISALPVSVR